MTRRPPPAVAKLQALLIHLTEATERAHVHLELARLAQEADRAAVALTHLREALALDPQLTAARGLLDRLTPPSRGRPVPQGRRDLGAMARRVTRRT